MRHALTLAIALTVAAPLGAAAQAPKQPQPQQPAAQKQQPAAPAVAPARPYKPVAIKLPAPLSDPSFEAFRKQLAETAGKKDRAGLSKMVVAQGFFWEGENGDKADKKKPGIDNLSAAVGLAGKEPVGWDFLAGHAQDPTATPFAGKQGVVCSPADPQFDEKALEELAKSTQTDPGDWAYPMGDGVEVRAAARPDAPVVEKLGLILVRIMQDEAPAAAGPNQIPLIKVVPPSGKIGFISADSLSPLGNDQICYIKEGNTWKIAGFVGAGAQ